MTSTRSDVRSTQPSPPSPDSTRTVRPGGDDRLVVRPLPTAPASRVPPAAPRHELDDFAPPPSLADLGPLDDHVVTDVRLHRPPPPGAVACRCLTPTVHPRRRPPKGPTEPAARASTSERACPAPTRPARRTRPAPAPPGAPRPRRHHRVGQVGPRHRPSPARTRGSRSCRSTRCRCTGGWTSAPPSRRRPSGPRCPTTCSTWPTRGGVHRGPVPARGPRRAVADIEARGHRALLVGGTGLYLRAVVDDLDVPGPVPGGAGRARGRARHAGPAPPPGRARPGGRGPHGADQPPPGGPGPGGDPRAAGRPFSSYGPGLDAYPPTPFHLVGVALPHEVVARRIAARYHQQMAAGFLDEVRRPAGATPGGLSRTAAPGPRLQGAHRPPGRRAAARRGGRPGRPPDPPVRPPPAVVVPARPPRSAGSPALDDPADAAADGLRAAGRRARRWATGGP